jgi:adenine C2-methylase RlmN of 23S rRNA A2503 and tRNA A37
VRTASVFPKMLDPALFVHAAGRKNRSTRKTYLRGVPDGSFVSTVCLRGDHKRCLSLKCSCSCGCGERGK